MTILITGGHLTPAIATIKELQKKKANIIFIGRKHSGRHKSLSQEHQACQDLGIKFIPFDAPKLHAKPLYRNFIEALKTPASLLQAYRILHTHKPDAILSFGGYLALPLCSLAALQRIPIITHEQTTVLGKTNLLIGHLARHIALSWPNTRHIPSSLKSKTTLTGNPLRSEFLTKQHQPTFKGLTLKGNIKQHQKPLIYITGGNQGAHAINLWVQQHLSPILNKYTLIHQCGHINQDRDLHQLKQARHQLIAKLQSRYLVKPWFSASETAWLFQNASLVIARAGANTATELLVSHTRSILIPLPHSAQHEQDHNADLLQHLGLAFHLPQANLDQLLSTINSGFTSNPIVPATSTAKSRGYQIWQPPGLTLEATSGSPQVKRPQTKHLPQQQQLKQLHHLHAHAAQSLAKLVLSCPNAATET